MNVIHRAWRWYFWASVAMSIFGVGFDMTEGLDDWSLGNILYTALGYLSDMLSLVCLYGFAWQVRIGKRQYWAVFFFMDVLFFFSAIGYTMLSSGSEIIEGMGLSFALGVLIMTAILILPLFVANYRYAFQNEDLWETR